MHSRTTVTQGVRAADWGIDPPRRMVSERGPIDLSVRLVAGTRLNGRRKGLVPGAGRRRRTPRLDG